MRIISNSLLIVGTAAALQAAASAQAPDTAACLSHLETIAPKLRDSGYATEWPAEPSGRFLRATHVEAAGRIDIEYRCPSKGLDVSVINHGLPTIPFHVLLAAGPGAQHIQAMPEWLRKREEAIRR